MDSYALLFVFHYTSRTSVSMEPADFFATNAQVSGSSRFSSALSRCFAAGLEVAVQIRMAKHAIFFAQNVGRWRSSTTSSAVIWCRSCRRTDVHSAQVSDCRRILTITSCWAICKFTVRVVSQYQATSEGLTANRKYMSSIKPVTLKKTVLQRNTLKE